MVGTDGAKVGQPGHSVIERVEQCLSSLEGLNVTFRSDQPGSAGRFQTGDSLRLDPRLATFLSTQFPQGLFSHQADGIASILAGKHTVISTSTSSGKSLVFSVPAIQALITDDAPTALFIYPQRALANDQLGKLTQMFTTVVGHAPAKHMISRYDGATDEVSRPAIREQARLVLTNPDMLHKAILQFPENWTRLLQNLKYVVVDEAHEYRGIFGSSVAYILRRLRAVASSRGARPVFISASATIKQATEHLRELTGLDFVEIGPSQDGSVQGRKRIWLARPTEHHWAAARKLTQSLVAQGLSCLTFCGSRILAERLLDDLPDSVRRDDRIRVYRAGLGSKEREATEQAIKDGSVKGVFCTSALELGIDIGVLDAVICIGLPSTMMSLWQRAGRVGRSGKEGAIIFLPADTPLDTYYLQNPEALLARETEPLAINLQNRRLLCHHLACAIDEAGDESRLDFDILGRHAKHAMELRRQNRLNHEVFYSDDKHMRTPIRSSDNQNFTLIEEGGAEARSIGEIDYWHMLREAYPHAIYLHGGRRYRVRDILRTRREVRLAQEWTPNRTIPIVKKTVLTRQPRRLCQYPDVTIVEAGIEVKELLIAVQEKKITGETVNVFEGAHGLPPYRMPTEGVGIELSNALTSRLAFTARQSDFTAVCHAIERLLGGLFPAIVGPCDRSDYSTFSDRRPQGVVFYLYDQVHDGIDLTTQVFDHILELFGTIRDRISRCDCTEAAGCFRCVRNPDTEEHVTKADCLAVAEAIIEAMESGEPQRQTFNVDVLEEQPEATQSCPRCQSKVKADANFCPECGERMGARA